jgi:hypothetical protein
VVLKRKFHLASRKVVYVLYTVRYILYMGLKRQSPQEDEGNASRFLQVAKLAGSPAAVIVANSRIAIEVDMLG